MINLEKKRNPYSKVNTLEYEWIFQYNMGTNDLLRGVKMVNDRGSIKWSAMMMPEHIQMLNEYWKEQEWKEKPILDEQQKEEIGIKLHLAIHDDLTVRIKYYKDHDFHYVKDEISSIDTENGCLCLNKTENVKFNSLIDVQLL